jgi:hypothetical protein
MASLDAVLQKTNRAAEHLKVLKSETLRFLQDHPGESISETTRESNRPVIGSTVNVLIPARIALIIGDVLQNLRSSLDYLIWELVLTTGYKPTDKSAFPICDYQAAFKMELRRHRLDDIPTPARTTIEGLQPYWSGEGQQQHHNLRVLDDLSNISKHRRVALSAVTVLGAEPELDSEAGSHDENLAGDLHQRSEFGVCLHPASHYVRERQLVTFIAFGDGPAKDVEIGFCLDRLWHYVNDVVLRQFESYFA